MPEAPRITAQELRRRMDAGADFTIIDVRNPQAWGQSDTMIPEAIRIPRDEFATLMAHEEWKYLVFSFGYSFRFLLLDCPVGPAAQTT